MLKGLRKITKIKWKYLLRKSVVINYGKIKIGKNVSISESKIFIAKGNSLNIGDNCVLKNVNIYIKKGSIRIGEGNLINNAEGFKKLLIDINDGTLNIGAKNRIQSVIRIRFGGIVTIGQYNNINDNTEIRSDEMVSIGDFNQISYDCIIWDTNTHNIYDKEFRRKLAIEHYPKYGYEFEKPKSSPVKIGNDCWLGRRSSILKGAIINDEVIVGYGTTVANIEIPCNITYISNINNRSIIRK